MCRPTQPVVGRMTRVGRWLREGVKIDVAMGQWEVPVEKSVFKETNVKRACSKRKWNSPALHQAGDPNGIRTQFPQFVTLRNSGHKRAMPCALEGKCKIRQFARIAQNYAVRVSEIVRNLAQI